MARAPKAMPEIKEPPAGAVCGVITAGGMCNLPLGHERAKTEDGHQRVSPMPEPKVLVDNAMGKVVDPTPETPQEAAQRIFAVDIFGARPVIAKLARIMGEIPEIKPTGHNAHFNYNFIKDTQISGAIRPRMAREGLIVIPDVVEESWVETKTKSGGISWVTKLKVLFTVIDSVSGDSISGHGFGYGDDSGDKGANKAITAAMKYWLIKLFQIGGEDDLESDSRADQRAAGREAGGGGGAAETGVRVEGGNIEGIARGGMSTKITNVQGKQIFNLYKDLELTPETFAERIDRYLGDHLALPENEDEHDKAIKDFLKAMLADDAGILISKMVEEKDAAGEAKNEEAIADEEAERNDAPYG